MQALLPSDTHPPTATTMTMTQTATSLPLTTRTSENFIIQSNPNAPLYILLIQVASSYLCYIFGKFACKIKIQEFSYALPLSLATPLAVVATIGLTWLRETDECSLNEYLPNYLSFKAIMSPGFGGNVWSFLNVVVKHYLWIWLLWWLSQLWITNHIWRPKNDKNLPTEKLFICPWYCGFLVEQCITLNRRIVDWNEEYLSIKVSLLHLNLNLNVCGRFLTGATSRHFYK